MRFSEWIQIESFLDRSLHERALHEAFRETVSSIMAEARKAFASPHVLSESSVPENTEDLSREELLEIVRESLKKIRLYGIGERNRMLEVLGGVGEWIDKSKNDAELEYLNPKEFSDVISPYDLKKIEDDDNNTFHLAALLLKRLGYITEKEELDIIKGTSLPEAEARPTMEFLDKKIGEALGETGNEATPMTKSDYEAAAEDLRRASLSLYESDIERKTIRDAKTSKASDFGLYDKKDRKSPIRNFERDELFNAFYSKLIEKAKVRRKSRNGSFLPWHGLDSSFEKALNDEDGQHLDRYLRSIIKTDSSGFRIKRGSSLNPVSSSAIGTSVSYRNRKKSILTRDLSDHMSKSQSKALDFYKEYLKKIAGLSESDMKKTKDSIEDGEDKIRFEILRDIKNYAENDPSASSQGISMDPERIYDSLSGYMMHVLASRERSATFFGDLTKDDDGSSDDVAAAVSGELGDVEKDKPSSDSGSLDFSRYDSGTRSAASAIAGQFPLAKFFRPYILRGANKIAQQAGSGGNVVRAMALCIKYNIPFSVSLKDNKPVNIKIEEAEVFDNQLDERIKRYIFSKMDEVWSCSCGRTTGFKNKDNICEKCGSAVSLDGVYKRRGDSPFEKTLDSEKWSHEDHEKATRRTIRDDSFCKWFFHWVSPSGESALDRQPGLYPPHRTLGDIANIISIMFWNKSDGTVFFSPDRFPSPVELPDGIEIRRGASTQSIGEFLSGQNPSNKIGRIGNIGADSDLCDEIFNMISSDEVSLKDMIIARQKEAIAKAQEIKDAREKADLSPERILPGIRSLDQTPRIRALGGRELPTSRPPLSSKPSPLGRFVRRQGPEETSSP